jgi:hypothetical protein
MTQDLKLINKFMILNSNLIVLKTNFNFITIDPFYYYQKNNATLTDIHLFNYYLALFMLL